MRKLRKRERCVAVNEKPLVFKLNRPRDLDCWGDYGSTLRNGSFDKKEQRIDRTGPFVPPITFPAFSGAVIVTDRARQQLEASGLSGVGEFRPVTLGKVVRIDWHTWDRTRKLGPLQLPFNGEPEEYLAHNPHDAATASQIGPLWTWHPLRVGKSSPMNGVVRLEGIIGTYDVFRLDEEWWTRILVTENGRRCVEGLFGEWVECELIKNEILS